MSVTRVLFTGDSITDCGRKHDPAGLGDGYVALIDAALRDDAVEIVNTGVSGDRMNDLRQRWTADCIAFRPDVITVLIGVNDTWRRYDTGEITSIESFTSDYRCVLDLVRMELPRSRVVLMDPFLVPITTAQVQWRADLESRIASVGKLAAEYGAVHVPLDDAFARVIGRGGLSWSTRWTVDGVHPTAEGHRLIADSWLTAMGCARFP